MCATSLIPPQPTVRRGPRHPFSNRVVEREIALHMTLSADRRRIFDALTLPEYIETWLSLPGEHSNCRTVAARTENGYQLDHYGLDRLDFSISGNYRVCRRARMLFTWRKSSATSDPLSTPESLVLIRLYGAFAQSTLLLTHTGRFSESEYGWTCDLWTLSLRKLQTLFSIH
jgi:uncharacterized protein YndB with AHSA1/START domain